MPVCTASTQRASRWSSPAAFGSLRTSSAERGSISFGIVTRSYVANLKNGRIENPGLSKLEAVAAAMGFPPALWFGTGESAGHAPDEAVGAALQDETLVALLEEAMRLGKRDRKLLLRMARQVSPSPESPTKATNKEGGET